MRFLDLNRLWAYVAASIIGFISPIGVLFLWLLIFIVVDMVCGIYASLVEGEMITSNRLQRTVLKFVMYATAVFLLHGIDVYMVTFLDLNLARIGCTLICGIELYSIFENCYRVTGNAVFKVLTQCTLKKIEESTGVSKNEITRKVKKPVHKGKTNERKRK